MHRLSRGCNLEAIRQRSGNGVLRCNLADRKRTGETGKRLFNGSG